MRCCLPYFRHAASTAVYSLSNAPYLHRRRAPANFFVQPKHYYLRRCIGASRILHAFHFASEKTSSEKICMNRQPRLRFPLQVIHSAEEKIVKDCSGKKFKSLSNRYPASFISAIMISLVT